MIDIPGSRDPIKQAFINGDSRIDLKEYYASSEGKPPQLLSHVMLGSILRDYFIKKVKAPLMNVLILVAKRIPEVTKQNTDYEGTHACIDIFDKFFEYSKVREPMFQAIFKIFLAEIEHDKFYRDAFLLFMEEVIKAILAGKIPPRDEVPLDCFWTNKTPLGGKHSIINILQSKKDLENLLGDDWKLREVK